MRKLRSEAGSPTYRVMAQRTGQGASTLSQAAAGERLPTLPVVLAYVSVCGGDPEEWEERWRQAAAEVAAEPRVKDEDVEPPYRGLARFEPGDAVLFFGRDELTDRLVELTRSRRFTAVFGPSGSGKSSLLRAGLIPRLRDPNTTESRPAALRVLTPGEHPLSTHSQRMVPAEGEGDTWLIVDQFEELYTLCQASDERHQFIDRLLAATDPESHLRVVISVRADFLGRCAEHPALTAVLQDSTLLVGPMSRDELRETIVKPAQTTGMIVERALTTRILDEVEGEPGALPLMSHALRETWHLRKGRALTEAAYEAVGGLHGAIARTAEAVYGALTPTQTTLIRPILLRLVAPGEATPDTRRPAHRSEFDFGDTTDVAAVLERLAHSRLVTLDEEIVELAHEALITAWPRLREWIDEDRQQLALHRRLSQDARAWDDLGRDAGALYRGVRLASAEEALATSRIGAHLTALEGEFLSSGLAARDRERQAAARSARRLRVFVVSLSCIVTMALMAGLLAWQQNQAAERQRVQAEARRLAAVAESMRSSDPATAMRLSLTAWKIAELPETRSALLGSMAQKGQDTFRMSQTTPDTDVVLSDDGRVAVSVVGGRAERWDVPTHRRLSSFSLKALSPRWFAIARDARTMAVGGDHDTAIWDMVRGRMIERLPGTGNGGLFYPNGHVLEVFNMLEPVTVKRFWDVRRHRLLLERRDTNSVDTEISPDSQFVALCPFDGHLTVRGIAGSRLLHGPWEKEIHGISCDSDKIAFMPDGHKLVVVTSTRVRVWDPASGRELSTITHSHLGWPEFSRDGKYLAAGDGSNILLWRLDTPEDPVFTVPLINQMQADIRIDLNARMLRYTGKGASPVVQSVWLGHALDQSWEKEGTTSAAFSPDGQLLATSRQSKAQSRLRLLDVHSGRTLTAHLATAPCPEGLWCTDRMAFSADNHTFAYTASNETKGAAPWVTIVDRRDPGRGTTLRLPSEDEGASVDALALSHDGRRLMISLFGDTEIWDAVRHTRLGRLNGVGGDALALRDDDRLLMTNKGELADLHSHKTWHTPLAQYEPVDVAFSHDGSYLAAAGDGSGWVGLWDGRARRRLGELPVDSADTPLADDAGTGGYTAMAISHDGATLAIGREDGSIYLWDVASRRRLGVGLSDPGGAVLALAFSSDDHRLYASATHMPLLRYELDSRRIASDVCGRVGEGLSPADWRTYVRHISYRTSC
ncbi:hypothetical protein ABZ608_30845 [Streptomyces sp. NPDC013172]|uniref:nSTAND1 domain-containing NTPase n=1 Tax=Streptomyces sp. NPDC013172 TaxID=3155009 RepID=UPI0033E9CA40